MFFSFGIGKKGQKNILRPESLEGTEEEDPVASLEWDPLSDTYILVANNHCGIRLIDSEGLSVITKFVLPSAAVMSHNVAWIGSAPGMFLSGGMCTRLHILAITLP